MNPIERGLRELVPFPERWLDVARLRSLGGMAKRSAAMCWMARHMPAPPAWACHPKNEITFLETAVVLRHPTSDGSGGTKPRPSGSGRLQAGFGADNRFLTGAARVAPRSTYVTLAIAVLTGWMTPASGQDPVRVPAQPTDAPADSQPESKGIDNALAGLTARKAVHEGNRRLLANDPTGALEAYRHAEEQSPNASEIAFVEGLAQFDMKAYEQAREAFEASAATSTGPLANDARYSLGTCDHAEALDHLDDPQAALPLIEKAIRRYQGVLADDTEHDAARDAMLKAAAMRRQIKQQMQQQQQQQQQSDDSQEKKDDQNQDQQQQQSEGDQEKQDQNEQEQGEDQEQKPQDSSEQQEGEQQDKPSEGQDQQSSDAEEQKQPSEAQEKEQVSREQAERKLREMMQAIRDRKKSRREVVRPQAGVAVKKDW